MFNRFKGILVFFLIVLSVSAMAYYKAPYDNRDENKIPYQTEPTKGKTPFAYDDIFSVLKTINQVFPSFQNIDFLAGNKINISTNKKNSTITISCTDSNIDYGEMFFFKEFVPEVVVIADANIYTPIPGFQAGQLLGITYADNNLTIGKDGNYLVEFSISFSGAGAGSLYGIVIGVNHIEQQDCYAHDKIDTAGSVESTGWDCILELNAGDDIVLFIEDETSPAKNANVFMANVNVTELVASINVTQADLSSNNLEDLNNVSGSPDFNDVLTWQGAWIPLPNSADADTNCDGADCLIISSRGITSASGTSNFVDINGNTIDLDTTSTSGATAEGANIAAINTSTGQAVGGFTSAQTDGGGQATAWDATAYPLGGGTGVGIYGGADDIGGSADAWLYGGQFYVGKSRAGSRAIGFEISSDYGTSIPADIGLHIFSPFPYFETGIDFNGIFTKAAIDMKDGNLLNASLIHSRDINAIEDMNASGNQYVGGSIITGADAVTVSDLADVNDFVTQPLTPTSSPTFKDVSTTEDINSSRDINAKANMYVGGQIITTTNFSNAWIGQNMGFTRTTADPFLFTNVAGRGIRFRVGSSGVFQFLDSGNTEEMTIQSDGKIYMPNIATSGTGNSLLWKSGLGGEVVEDGSSIRFKKNIRDISDVAWLHDLRPIIFDDINDDNETDVLGLIAEEVFEVNPDVVTYDVEKITETKIDDWGKSYEEVVGYNITNIPRGVSYREINIAMLKEIQNLREELDALKDEIDLLKQGGS